MKTNDFNELMESVREASNIMAGKVSPSRHTLVSPIDIKRIRSSLNVSQNFFAKMIGVSVNTLQNWEQGRRQPKGPARALLDIIRAQHQRHKPHAFQVMDASQGSSLPQQ